MEEKIPISRMWITDATGMDHEISISGARPSYVVMDEIADFTPGTGTMTYKDGITFSRGIDVDGDLWTKLGVDPAPEPAVPGEWADSIEPLPDL